MKYEKPTLEILKFEERDVITLSLGGSDDEIGYQRTRTLGSEYF